MHIQELVKNRIIELCSLKKWSYNALAIYSGISPSTMKSILSGRSDNTGIVTIKKICDGLEISISDFFDTEAFRKLEQEID